MVLADLGRKITAALRSLSSATVINEEVISYLVSYYMFSYVGCLVNTRIMVTRLLYSNIVILLVFISCCSDVKTWIGSF